MSTHLQEVVRGWRPERLHETRVVDVESCRGFARLLDQPDPVGPDGEVPALWHWFTFTPRYRTNELGDDGHPRDGRFLPPIPDRRRMLGGGQLELRRPLQVGRRYTRTTSLDRAEVKHGRSGEMVFVRTRHELTDDDGLVAVEHEDVVYRSQPSGEPRPLPAIRADGTDLSQHPPEVQVPTDPVTLLRFSALTGNAHRIHYDHPYVTGVEQYPGLVVHGPLLALAMLEPARRSGARVRALEFRLRSPMFVGDTVLAATHPQRSGPGQTVASAISKQTGALCATGTVTLGQPDR